MHKKLKIFGMVILIALLGAVNDPIPLHEPDGNCHTPYNHPMTEKDHCRHNCDHELCACDAECKKTCKGDEECYHKCGLGPCLNKYGTCSHKCENKQ